MVQQLSTSASDALLTLSVLYLIYIVFWENFFAAVGVAIQGATAILGIVRFVQTRPRSQLCEYHQMMSWLAQVVGIPLLAVGFCHKDMPVMMNLNLMSMVALLICSNFLPPGMRQLATESCVGFGLLTIILVSFRSWNIYALLATLVYIASRKVIGSEGKIGVLYRMDIFHVGLSFGNILFAWGIKSL